MTEPISLQVTVKGLFQDESGKFLIVRDVDGSWELPGGRMDPGEDVLDTLKREWKEEMGVEIEILDNRPLGVWVGTTDEGLSRLVVIYKIKPKSFDYKKSDEANEVFLVSKEDFNKTDFVAQLSKLKDLVTLL